jgi:hypothetical protein
VDEAFSRDADFFSVRAVSTLQKSRQLGQLPVKLLGECPALDLRLGQIKGHLREYTAVLSRIVREMGAGTSN